MKWRQVLIIAVITILVYLPGISGGFVYDDFVNFLENDKIVNSDFSLNAAWQAMQSGFAGPSGRPIPMLSFYLNYQVGGSTPISYKIFNILIHVLNSILIFFISGYFLRGFFLNNSIDRSDKHLTDLAFWIALIWAINPINVTSVLYIVQRMNSMAGLFTLMGILIYCIVRQSPGIKTYQAFIGMILTVLMGAIAGLCKENGLLLFLFLFIIEIFVFNFRFENIIQKKLIITFHSLVLSSIFLLFIYLFLINSFAFNYSAREFNLSERILTESRVIWFYISQIIIPQVHLFGLHHDGFEISRSLVTPVTTLISCIGIIAISLLSIISIKKNKIFGFSILFFLTGHIMESTILPLNLVHEHRNYIPSLGLIILFVIFLDTIKGRVKFINHKIIFFLYSMFIATVTFYLAFIWGDMERFADKQVQIHTSSANSNYEAAFIYTRIYKDTNDQAYLDKATNALGNAVKLDPHSMKSALSLLHVLSMKNETPDKGLLDRINFELRNGKIKTEDIIAMRQLVFCQLDGACTLEDELINEFFTSILDNPELRGRQRDDALYFYADYLDIKDSNVDYALDIMRDIVARNPDILEYQVKLITILLRNNQIDEAKRLMDDLTNKHGYQWNIIENE